jgi:hypothetical protein
VPRVGVADLTLGRLVARAHEDLANGIGNLVDQVVTTARGFQDDRVGQTALTGPSRIVLACPDVRSGSTCPDGPSSRPFGQERGQPLRCHLCREARDLGR